MLLFLSKILHLNDNEKKTSIFNKHFFNENCVMEHCWKILTLWLKNVKILKLTLPYHELMTNLERISEFLKNIFVLSIFICKHDAEFTSEEEE